MKSSCIYPYPKYAHQTTCSWQLGLRGDQSNTKYKIVWNPIVDEFASTDPDLNFEIRVISTRDSGTLNLYT